MSQTVKIMSALVIRAMVDEVIVPRYRARGYEPDFVWNPTVALMKSINEDGARADAIVAINWALDELAQKGLIDPSTLRPVAQASVGLAVRRGVPRPDISTGDKLRQVLLDTPSLCYSRAGASGIYFEKLIDRLGIGDAIRAKATVIPVGLTGEKAASGEVDLAIQQVSELMAVKGIDFVGPFPDELQATTDFSAAVFADSAHRAGAAAFIDILLTPEARQAYIRTGLEPLFS